MTEDYLHKLLSLFVSSVSLDSNPKKKINSYHQSIKISVGIECAYEQTISGRGGDMTTVKASSSSSRDTK